MKVNIQRHPKEHLYRTICLAAGGLIWAAILISTKGFTLVPIFFLGISLWLSGKFFEAMLFGNSVFISGKQYPLLNKIIEEESKKLLGNKKPPLAFVYNSDGAMNALAVKFLSKKYIILYDNLIDVLWSKKNDELRFVISHEVAHHAADHTNFWINIVLAPAMVIPYLGPAYSRARELTADRTAATSVNNAQASMKALIALASGSKELQSSSNIDEFIAQEKKMPRFFGFLLEILASHPRLTLRVIALMKNNNIKSSPRTAAAGKTVTAKNSSPKSATKKPERTKAATRAKTVKKKTEKK